MPGDDNVALALGWLEAWGRGDNETVSAAMLPEVEIHAAAEVGNEGTFRGVDGYRRWEALWMEAWDDFRNEVLRAEAVGDRHVIVDARQRGTGRGSGVEVDREVSMLVEIREGRIARFHIYATREGALAAASA